MRSWTVPSKRFDSTDEVFQKPFALEPTPRLSESEWQDLRQVVHRSVGINLSEAKRVFLVSRLLKRLRATGVRTFREYFRLLKHSDEFSGEHQQFVNAITTNKTDFFRESDHFLVLEQWLAKPSSHIRATRKNGLRIWCAAASTGEEPYSIAAVLRANLTDDEFRQVRLVASDIDTNVLEFARRGVYDEAALEPLTPQYRAKMFVPGSGAYRGKHRVRAELRDKVQFFQENLVSPQWKAGNRFDIIFCRNVLIYFERATQQAVVRRMLEHIEPHGLLFLGHSESLNSLSIPAKPVAHAVYALARQHSTLPPKHSSPPGPVHRSCHVMQPVPRARSSSVRPPKTLVSYAPREAVMPDRGSMSLRETAVDLRVGECRLDAPQWLKATLMGSALLVLYPEQHQTVLVCHLEARDPQDAEVHVRNAVHSMLEALRREPTMAASVRGRLVVVNDAMLPILTQYLGQLGVIVETTKVAPEVSDVWVEPHSIRVLLRRGVSQ
jgi:chemotaxis protein methyltransferase CheR